MNTTKEKIELAKLVLELEDPALIEKIHKMVIQKNGDFWSKLSKGEKAEIELGISQLNKGEKISFDDYIKKVG